MAEKAQELLEAKLQESDRLRASVRDYVLNGNIDKLREIFDGETVDDSIIEQAWDLIPALCEGITERNETEKTELVDVCFDAIKLLAEKGNAKEVVLALLEQADTFLPDFKWQGLLEPIQISLLRLPSKRQYSLQTTLETLYAHIELIEIPQDLDAEDEKKLLALDSEVSRLLDNVRLYVNFLEPFVLEIPQDKILSEDLIQQRNYLLVAIFKILAKKLMFLYFDTVDDMKPAVWYLGEKLMKFVAHLCRDLYKATNIILDLMTATEKKDSGDSSEDSTPTLEQPKDDPKPSPLPHVSAAIFHYLLHAEGMSIEKLPSVLTPNHVFEHCLPSIALMFSSPRSVIVNKAAKLALKLLDYKPLTKFSHQVLDLKHFTAFMDNLLQAVVMCQSKEVRSHCVKIFPLLLRQFDARGKHTFFIYSFKHTGHSGVKGHLLQLLKEELVKSFDEKEGNDSYMTESRVTQVVQLMFVLPEGAISDLLDQSDLIINCLNFLRYLAIRDKKNRSGIWNHIPKLEDEYFEQLRQALKYSRGHYEQELLSCKAGKSGTEDLLMTGIDYKVKVGKKDLPVDIPKEHALGILEGALGMFDLIQSLFGRLEEVIKVAKKERIENGTGDS